MWYTISSYHSSILHYISFLHTLGEQILHDLVHVLLLMSEFLKDLVCYCGGINVFIMLFIIDCIDLLMGLVGGGVVKLGASFVHTN